MKYKLLVPIFLVVTAISVNAITIVTYSFTGAAGNEVSLPADSQPANAHASDMARGTGLTTSFTAADAFTASGWTSTAGIDVNDYFSFSLTPNAGFSMSLTELILDEKRSGTGIRNWSVRSSLDNYGSDLKTFSVPDDLLTRTGQTIVLSSLFNDLTSVLEFRIYGYAAENSSSGTWRIDNVKLNGTVSAIPAVPDSLPSTYAALTFLFVFGLGYRVRRQSFNF